MEAIDLDANATTPLDPMVLEAMRPYWLAGGNPESRHGGGRGARKALDEARECVARILGADPSEVVFTSGGTEANNLALFGLAGMGGEPGHVVSSRIEHVAVGEVVERLSARGMEVTRASVRPDGRVGAEEILGALREETRLATLMLANNETGAIQPVRAVSEGCAERGVRVHTDAVQGVGRIRVNFHELGVATLAASAHKLHGPGGVGVLLVRRGINLTRHLLGGSQQGNRRPGTVPVALCVGMAAALQRWEDEAEERTRRWRGLRRRLIDGLREGLGTDGVVIHGPADPVDSLPQTLNVGFPGSDGDALLMQLDLSGVRASLGAACASGSTQASPVMDAMGVSPELSRASVRFSFGATLTAERLGVALSRIVEAARRGRLAGRPG